MDTDVGVGEQMKRAAECLALDGQRVGIGIEPLDEVALRQALVRRGAVFEDLIDEQRNESLAVVHLTGGFVFFFAAVIGK